MSYQNRGSPSFTSLPGMTSMRLIRRPGRIRQNCFSFTFTVPVPSTLVSTAFLLAGDVVTFGTVTLS